MAEAAPALLLYEQSSQHRHWQFTAEQLLIKRQHVNTEGVAQTLAALKMENQLKLSTLPESIITPELEESQCISWTEQLEYCRFYEGKIIDYCKFFGFDKTVQATAIVFFKRFYLNNTVMDYDPKIILMTCLFLSTKVENSLMSLDEFLSKVPKSPDASTYIQSSQPRTSHVDLTKRLYAVYNQASSLITSSLISDISFIYMPSQIALAAIKETGSHVTVIAPIIDAFISDRFQNESPTRIKGIFELLELIRADLRGVKELVVDKSIAAAVAFKLKTCSNPEFDSSSCLFLMRKKEEEQAAESKRLKKAEKAKASRDQLATIVN
ncbi:hypothetical protein BASA81_018394 [Batrachochytrium salamandrivorans]|nr:hypothetical protein BASA81_018394 [Batrachochytrium salamandrivorans]